MCVEEEDKFAMGDEGASSTVQTEDVPVNRITTFNGKLNQYLHAAGIPNKSADRSNTSVDLNPLPRELKRRATTSTELAPTTTDREDSSSSSSKRKKASPKRGTTSSTTGIAVSPRLTRARSNSSIPPSPSSTSQSPTTRSPSRRRRSTPRTKTSPMPPSPRTPSLLRDTIPPNLILLLVGVNPGIMTGTTGYAYAHPSNLFWKLLHSSGITRIRHPPSDTYKLPELYSVGNTNIVERPTRDASMLSRAEMDAGVPVLEAKVAAQRPEAVCVVGKSIWEAVWRVRRGRAIRKEEFRYGWQDERENMGRTPGSDWVGAPVFVATTTSGLAAGMSVAEKQAVWAQLGAWVVQRREERALLSSSSIA